VESQKANTYMVPDESFELDLDSNFQEALKILEMLGLTDIDQENFLKRPDEEGDEENQNAYEEDNDDDYANDVDLDIF